MSGLEIVGLVLGAVPLLLQGAKLFEPHFKSFLLLNRSFPDMIENMLEELVRFEHYMKMFIEPLRISPDLREQLLGSSQLAAAWEDPQLQSLLSERMGRRLRFFLKKIRRVEEIVSELLSVLPQKDDGTIDMQVKGPQVFRLAMSFGKRSRLIDEFAELNRNIFQYLEENKAFAQISDYGPAIMGQGRKDVCAITARPFLKLQHQAATLHRLFAPHSWECTCGSQHPCGITVKYAYNRFGKVTLSLQMLLGPPGNLRMRLDFEKSGPQHTVSTEHRSRSSLGEISDLTHQLDSLRVSSHTGPTAYSSKRGIGKAGSGGPKLPEKLARRRDRKLQGGKSFEPHGVHQVHAKDAGSVRFNQAHIKPADSETTQTHLPAEVRCDFFTKNEPASAIRFLVVDEATWTFYVLAQPQHSMMPPTLSEFCRSIGQTDARIELGIGLAYTILSLGKSPWFPRNWGDDNLGITVDQSLSATPFYLHQSIRHALQRTMPDERFHAENTIFTFGMVLLQLLFGHGLEEQQFWQDYLQSGSEVPEWQPEVKEKFGEDIAAVVHRCVDNQFVAPANLTADDFIHEVMTSVVRPLEKYVKEFSS